MHIYQYCVLTSGWMDLKTGTSINVIWLCKIKTKMIQIWYQLCIISPLVIFEIQWLLKIDEKKKQKEE